MFTATGNPGYIINEVLTTLPSFMAGLSDPENIDDQSKRYTGLNGNIINGRTVLYFNPTYVWAIQDIDDDVVQFFTKARNDRIPFVFVPHIDSPLINYQVFVDKCYRINQSNYSNHPALVVELLSVTPLNKLLIEDDLRAVRNNVIATSP